MNLHDLIPRPHEHGLSDEENEAYYVGAKAAVDAILHTLHTSGDEDYCRAHDYIEAVFAS